MDNSPLTLVPKPDPEYTLQKERKRCFAMAYAHGMPLSHALRAGHYEMDFVKGAELLKDPMVVETIRAERSFLEANFGTITKAQIFSRFEQLRDFAFASGELGAAAQATASQAKMMGYLEPENDKKGGKFSISWEA